MQPAHVLFGGVRLMIVTLVRSPTAQEEGSSRCELREAMRPQQG